MYKGFKNLILAVLFGLVLPGLLLHGAFANRESAPSVQEQPATTQTRETICYIPVLNDHNEAVLMDLESYVTCVLLREIPSDFHPEAMKAQAVAARTYALRRYVLGFKHENAAVCVNSACCQAFRTPDAYLSEGGDPEGLQQIRKAVESTKGQVLYYDGQLIEATYFSSSGGMTEAAVAVWGEDIPYLQATESPGEEINAHHTETVEFSWNEIAEKLGISLSGAPQSRFTDTLYTQGGGVESMKVCGNLFTGKELRSLLGLRSTAFSVYLSDEGISIVTRGFGHRVGMSQYGANAMAEKGEDYKAILAHYYMGTQLLEYTVS